MTGAVTVTGAAGLVTGSIVGVYRRETIARRTEAPTFRNMAHAAFDTNRKISRVIVLLTDSGVPLLLIEAGHLWFDVTAQPVRIVGRDANLPNGREDASRAKACP